MIKYKPEFLEFYALYPRKKDKIAAAKAYDQVVKLGATHAEIIRGVVRFAEHHAAVRQEMCFTKLPATWLRAGAFEDEYTTEDRTASRKSSYADSLKAAAENAISYLEQKEKLH